LSRDGFSAELLKGVARAIEGSGYELVVFSGCGRPDDQVGWERRYLSRVSGTLCDGALLATPSSLDVTFARPSSPSITTSARRVCRRSMPTT
jgi:LacI family transcriptional regulator